jgi:hypothetical protein
MEQSTVFAPLVSLPQASTALGTYTNLPDVEPGVFNVSIRTTIRSTVPAAWDALTDFPSYPDWNPFVRSSTVVSFSNITLPEQYPVEGKYLWLRTQIPALPLPVDKDTSGVLMNTQFALEKIVAVQPELGRLAWKYATDTLIQAVRWQAVSDIGDGMVLYESREVFSGLAAGVLKSLMVDKLQASFEAQGEGLKLWLEREGAERPTAS